MLDLDLKMFLGIHAIRTSGGIDDSVSWEVAMFLSDFVANVSLRISSMFKTGKSGWWYKSPVFFRIGSVLSDLEREFNFEL